MHSNNFVDLGNRVKMGVFRTLQVRSTLCFSHFLDGPFFLPGVVSLEFHSTNRACSGPNGKRRFRLYNSGF